MRRILLLVLALLALSTSARAQGGYTAEIREWTSQAGRILHGYAAYQIGPDGAISVLTEDDPRVRAWRTHSAP